jgi:hypothetical protein
MLVTLPLRKYAFDSKSLLHLVVLVNVDTITIIAIMILPLSAIIKQFEHN